MRLGALVSAGVLGLGLAACSGDDTASDPTTAVTTPAEDEGAGAGDGTTATEAGDDGGSSTPVGEVAEGEEIPVEDFMAMLQEPGEETLSSYTMAMSMDVDGQAMDVDGAMDLSGEQPAMQLTMSMPDLGEIEMLLVDGSMYMAVPGLTPEGQYMEAPPEMMGDVQDLDEIDVSAQWEAWEQAEKVVFVGTEDVDGTEVRRYEVTVNEGVVNEAVESAAEEMGDAAAATSAAMSGPIVYDVYLDEDNLMRKMVADIDGTTMEMTMDNWGEDPGIEAPSPDQITDMGDMGTGPTG